MKKSLPYLCLVLFLLLLCGSCSRKGVHMPKHRKRTHCNCPTFTESMPADSIYFIIPQA